MPQRKYRSVKLIVFDARKNGGGDSSVGERIFDAATGGLEYDRTGIERLPQGGRVDVTVEVIADQVIVTIVNDLPAQAGSSGGHAVGLASARERVDALTEGRGRVESRIEDGRYVTRMVLPLTPAN